MARDKVERGTIPLSTFTISCGLSINLQKKVYQVATLTRSYVPSSLSYPIYPTHRKTSPESDNTQSCNRTLLSHFITDQILTHLRQIIYPNI